MGYHWEAVEGYTAAIDCDPANANALFNRAKIYYAHTYFYEAAEDYSQVIDLQPDDAEAYNNRGLAYDAQDNYQAALADFDQAIALRPGFRRSPEQQGGHAGNHGPCPRMLLRNTWLPSRPLPISPQPITTPPAASRDWPNWNAELTIWTAPSPSPRNWKREATRDDELRWILDLRRIKARDS